MQNEPQFFVYRTTAHHLHDLAGKFRDNDIEVCQLVGNWTPEEMIQTCLSNSEKLYTILHGEVPLAIYGATPTEVPGIFVPWIVANRNINRHGLGFVWFCRAIMRNAEAMNRIVEAFQFVPVHHGGEASFLTSLGFKAGDTYKLFGGVEFTRFSLRGLPVRFDHCNPYRGSQVVC